VAEVAVAGDLEPDGLAPAEILDARPQRDAARRGLARRDARAERAVARDAAGVTAEREARAGGVEPGDRAGPRTLSGNSHAPLTGE
jgi:hypothetical protein